MGDYNLIRACQVCLPRFKIQLARWMVTALHTLLCILSPYKCSILSLMVNGHRLRICCQEFRITKIDNFEGGIWRHQLADDLCVVSRALEKKPWGSVGKKIKKSVLLRQIEIFSIIFLTEAICDLFPPHYLFHQEDNYSSQKACLAGNIQMCIPF